jgi:hypothetical protein
MKNILRELHIILFENSEIEKSNYENTNFCQIKIKQSFFKLHVSFVSFSLKKN